VLAAPLRAFTPFTVTDPARLRRVLADVRRTGIATSDRQITDNAYSVGAPVSEADGRCVAALSVVVPADAQNRASWGPAVRAAGLGISRRLNEQVINRALVRYSSRGQG
jgi:DNA-binding IclR family transcriptional regulator